MPASYKIDGHLFRIVCTEITPIQEVKDLLVEGLASEDCPRTPALLIDVSGSTSLPDRSPHEIRDMAGFLAQHADRIGGRCAVVAESDVNFGLIRMGSVHSEDSGLLVQVFRTTSNALEWLGAPPHGEEPDPARSG